MANLQYIAASLLLFMICMRSANGLSCYECNSHNDTRCSFKDNLPDDLKKECPQKANNGKPYILCRKIKQVIDFEVNGLPPDTRIIRACGWDDSNYANRCYQRSGFGGRQEVCACADDYCNSSIRPFLTTSTLVLAAVVYILGAM